MSESDDWERLERETRERERLKTHLGEARKRGSRKWRERETFLRLLFGKQTESDERVKWVTHSHEHFHARAFTRVFSLSVSLTHTCARSLSHTHAGLAGPLGHATQGTLSPDGKRCNNLHPNTYIYINIYIYIHICNIYIYTFIYISIFATNVYICMYRTCNTRNPFSWWKTVQ